MSVLFFKSWSDIEPSHKFQELVNFVVNKQHGANAGASAFLKTQCVSKSGFVT